MTIEVQAPDGSVVEFPDDMDETSIDRAMRQHFQTPARRIAEDFAELPQKFGDIRPTREVSTPHEAFHLMSPDSLGELMRNPSQRARNVATGEGPGSVAGIPGVAIGAAPLVATGAGVVGGGLAKGAGAAGRAVFGDAHEANAAQWVARLIAGGGGEELVKAAIRHLTATLSGK